MRILSIDTSCDETAVAVTEGTKVLSNIIWSQASLHAKFGGVYPSLAQREHAKRIDWVIEKALKTAFPKILVPSAYSLLPNYIDAVAVTVGPGLAIALEVGIKKAKELCKKYEKPIIPANHVEGHLLSPLARPKNSPTTSDHLLTTNISFPSIGLVVSGGTTQLIFIKKIGDYEILAETIDDALGEALDKGARMLGLGYPGGAILEKIAREGHRLGHWPGGRASGSERNPESYSLPIPLIGQEERHVFSYSGLKTALYRLIEKEKPLTKTKIENLAASYQDVAFDHLIRVLRFVLTNNYSLVPSALFVGGGVGANVELRKRIRKMCKEFNISPLFPYSKKLYGDNAAMIGVAAYFKAQKKEFAKDIEKVERIPRARIDEPFPSQFC